MKLCDVFDKFWTWLLSKSYVSPKISEWGCVVPKYLWQSMC